MEEVNQLSEGLVEEKSQKQKRRLPFSKITFVKATAASAAWSALDIVEDDEDDDEEDKDDDDDDDVKDLPDGRTATSKVKQTPAATAIEVSDDDSDGEVRPSFGGAGLGFGGAGLGFGSSSKTDKTSSAETKNTFVFGKSDYTRKLGFVKGATQPASDGAFKFGVPFEDKLDATTNQRCGDFVFGGTDPKVSEARSSTFKFGVGDHSGDVNSKTSVVDASERRRSFDELSSHMESTSLSEAEGPLSKSPKLDVCPGYEPVLAKLSDLRSELREIRPPLNKSRVEYAMLQISMTVTASGGKLQWEQGPGSTLMKMYGVQIATGSDEACAYKDFIAKVFDDDPWMIVSGSVGPVLCLTKDANSLLRTGTSPMSRGPQDIVGPEPGSSQATLGLNSRFANGQIIRNLIEVRNTIWTPNFKSKVAMFGGPMSNVQSSLNMAFQLAKLRPVRDAIVPGTFLKPEYLMTTGNRMTVCQLVFHGVVLTDASARAKGEAKQIASKKLYEILESRMKFEIIERNGRNWLQTTGSAEQDRRAQTAFSRYPVLTRQSPAAAIISPGYRELFVVRPAKAFNLTGLLNMFASANSLALEFNTDAILRKGITVQVCRLQLPTNPPLIFEGTGETKQVARTACVRGALEQLIRHCFTIDVRQAIVEGAQEFSKETMPLGMESHAVQEGLGRQLDEDNVGYRLLQNMGWRGGGLGQGTGVVEPIMLKDNMGGRGLGYDGAGAVSKRFKSHVASTLRVFLRETDVFDELKFSPSFSNVERKEIHTIARRLGKDICNYFIERLEWLYVLSLSFLNITFDPRLLQA